ncbi:hypothetical protein PsorP6_011587 [Peronosclerospora sorghi]|uniref:Uncharacterized protein n=1 Tax=Peronosclerospora sorghi TaxID=230839 RepID=A0ACC0WJQ7_9STRA|nr:hypothetical protein PsorP6_011587 [Peronosclerospora sorghi]
MRIIYFPSTSATCAASQKTHNDFMQLPHICMSLCTYSKVFGTLRLRNANISPILFNVQMNCRCEKLRRGP